MAFLIQIPYARVQVRSSYRAGEFYVETMLREEKEKRVGLVEASNIGHEP